MTNTDIKWWKQAVIYQVYPRSFADSNGDGIGDLQGIIAKLAYLENLGIDAIWLSPVCRSPQDDNGYDISDYQDIDPMFGTLEDMEMLIAEAEKHHIRIIMDLVLNHSSDEHHWFQEAKKSRENPYHDYYVWRDGVEGEYPNDMRAAFGGPAWEWVPEVQQYYFHQFSVKQPDLNWENPKLRQEIYDMINWWIEKGVGGFRLDVIDQIAKEPDKKITCNGPRLHEFLRELSRETFQKADLVTVGEAWGATTELAKLYSNPDNSELSMVFQFEHICLDQMGGKEKWDLAPLPFMKLKQVFKRWQTQLYGQGWNSLFWNNHDLPRIVSRWGNDGQYRVESAKMLAILLHGMQGTPYIYQGEELGMTNAAYAITDYRDIETLNLYQERLEKGYDKEDIMRSIHAKSRDNARTPMQWSDDQNAGFTKGEPWLRINPNYREINAESQVNDEDSVFSCYKRLVWLRKQYPVLVDGKFQMLLENDENIFAYQRIDKDSRILVVCNFYGRTVECPLEEDISSMELLISNYRDTEQIDVLRPYEARMYYQYKRNPYREHEAHRAFLDLYTGKQRKNSKLWMDYFTSPAFLAVHREPDFMELLLEEVEQREQDCPPTREFQTWLKVAYRFNASCIGWTNKQEFDSVTGDTDFDGIGFIFQIAAKGPAPRKITGNELGMSICFSEYHELMKFAEDGTWDDQAVSRARDIIGHYVLSDLKEKCVICSSDAHERHIAGLRLLNDFYGRGGLPEELYRILWERLSLKTATMGRAKLLYGRLRALVVERIPDIEEAVEESFGDIYYSGFHGGNEDDPQKELDMAEAFFAKSEVQRALRDRRWVEDYLLRIWLAERNSVAFLQKLIAFYAENTDVPWAERVMATARQLLIQKEVKRQLKEDQSAVASVEAMTFDNRPFFRYWLNTGFYTAKDPESGQQIETYLNECFPFQPEWSREFWQTPKRMHLILDDHVIEIIFHVRYMEYKLDAEPVYQPFLHWSDLLGLLGEDNQSLFLLLPVTAAAVHQHETVRGELLRRLMSMAAPEGEWSVIAGLLAGHVCCLSASEEAGNRGKLFLYAHGHPKEECQQSWRVPGARVGEKGIPLLDSQDAPLEYLPLEMLAENEDRVYGWNWFPHRGLLVFFEQTSRGRRDLKGMSYERIYEWDVAVPMAQRMLHDIASPASFNLSLLWPLPGVVRVKRRYAPEEILSEVDDEIDQDRLKELIEQYAQGNVDRLQFSWAARSLVFLKAESGYACICFNDSYDQYLILLSQPERYDRVSYSGRQYVRFNMGKLPDYGIHQNTSSIIHKLDKVFAGISGGDWLARDTSLWAIGSVENHEKHRYHIAKQKLGGFPAEEEQNDTWAKFVFSRYPQQVETEDSEGNCRVTGIQNGNKDVALRAMVAFMQNDFSRLRLTWDSESGEEAWYPFHIVLLQENGRYMMACLRDDTKQALYYVADVRTYMDVEGKKYPKDTFMGRTTPAYLIHSDARKIRNCLDLIFDDMGDLPVITGEFAAFASESPVKARTYEEIRSAFISSQDMQCSGGAVNN